MNEKALESFIGLCDDMMVPVQEGFGMTIKNIALNAKNAISRLIKILLEKIRALREYFKTNVVFSIESRLYNKLVGLSGTYQDILGKYMQYILCKQPFTNAVKKEYENELESKVLDELNKIPKWVIRTEYMVPVVDSKAKDVYKSIINVTQHFEATAKVLDGVLGRLEASLNSMNQRSQTVNTKAIGGPTTDNNTVNESISLANRHVWLLNDTITILNKFIVGFRKTIGTSSKAVKKGSGANTTFA